MVLTWQFDLLEILEKCLDLLEAIMPLRERGLPSDSQVMMQQGVAELVPLNFSASSCIVCNVVLQKIFWILFFKELLMEDQIPFILIYKPLWAYLVEHLQVRTQIPCVLIYSEPPNEIFHGAPRMSPCTCKHASQSIINLWKAIISLFSTDGVKLQTQKKSKQFYCQICKQFKKIKETMILRRKPMKKKPWGERGELFYQILLNWSLHVQAEIRLVADLGGYCRCSH